MQSIEEIESQRDRNETDDEWKVDGAQWPAPQTQSMTMPWISSDTSLKRSTTFSR